MNKNIDPIVIIGGGHAGVALCQELVGAGLGSRVHLVCAETRLPYQRPPLSKTFLKSSEEQLQSHRGWSWFADSCITLHIGDEAVAIDPINRHVTLRSGVIQGYGWLVLATGTSARLLPSLQRSTINMAVLRTADDAERLRKLLPSIQKITVLGGGFIGLEIAATARELGKSAVVLESASRLLPRSVSAELAEYIESTHRASGIDIRLGIQVDAVYSKDDRITALSVNGKREDVELLVVGIGSIPETFLAEEAGLRCDNGITVDAFMRTSDDSILAIGDVAQFPLQDSDQRCRLESVQNANDQARTAVATILGQHEPYRALPWFWSDQGVVRLQMAGLMPAHAIRYLRPGASTDKFSILHYVNGRLACVESVNAPVDHMAARKLLEAGMSPNPVDACKTDLPLKSFLVSSDA